jgi:uncharacterized protein YbjT (DUF2867 family)
MYVITGATGHVGSKVVARLLAKSKSVRMIARHEEKMKNFEEKGAEGLVGSLEDTDFLTRAFRNATAVFAMEPTNPKAENEREYQNIIGGSIANAVKSAGVRYVVNLSSVGAHLQEGAGVVQGLHDQEERLNQIEGLNVLHLRPAYYMENLYSSMGMIKAMNTISWTFDGDKRFPMVATDDIAEVAAAHLINLDFEGKQVKYILGPRDVSYKEVTSILGKQIGKRDLQYIRVGEEEVKKTLMKWGVSENASEAMVQLADGINQGRIYEDARRTPENTTKTSIEKFARQFAEVYRNS